MPRLTSFREFWPHYLREHRSASCRALHYLGTAGTLLGVTLAVLISPKYALAIPLLGYGPAWIGHFAIERNRPASFRYPLWSAVADFRMFGLWITGRLGGELRAAPAPPAEPQVSTSARKAA